MEKRATRWVLHSFWLSIFLHLLLALAFLIVLNPAPQPRPPQYYQAPIPAYTYTGAITPAPSPSKRSVQASSPPQSNNNGEPLLTTTKGSYNFAKNTQPRVSRPHPSKSILEMSRETIQQNQMMTNLRREKSEEPILLVGDEHAVANPLIKLLGRALSAHFNYPKMEGEFGVRGRVLVDLVFHPEGYFSNVSIVESSNNANFDAAALYAVNTAPKVIGADHFLDKPKHFVVGFIFN